MEGSVAAWAEVDAVGGDRSPAEQLALDALRFFAVPGEGRLPTVGEIDAFRSASSEERALAALAAHRAARAALLRFDATELAIWIDALEGLGEDEVAAVSLASARGWQGLLAGEHDLVSGAAEELRQRAGEAAWAAEVIEATALRALGAELAGEHEEATTLARRASRMSRTESLPQEEYLANLALARVRRLDGKPHLGARILGALLRVATPSWRPWMTWELFLAGVDPFADAEEAIGLDTTFTSVATGTLAATTLRAALQAAKSGDRDTFARLVASVRETVAGAHPLRADLEVLLALLETAPVVGDPRVAEFRRGAEHTIPRGLSALAMLSGEREAAYVHARPEGAARVLAPALGLLADVPRLPETKKRQARTENTIAALLLAGPEGLDEDALFHSVYGFAYQGERHRGVRDVLYHRVRERVAERARFERGGGQVRLVVDGPLLAPDPRPSPPPEHALILVLAARGVASPKQAAEVLGLPLRTVQDALKRLAADGACKQVKQGRKLTYEVEDTTFLEPTKV